MLRYVDKIILPYVSSVRDSLPLSQCNQRAIALFDIFKATQSPTLLKKLKDNNITPLFVPASCTDRLQPLNLSVNFEYKQSLKGCFHDCYSNQVAKMLGDKDGDVTTVANVDMKTSTLKPIHAEWLISTHYKMEGRGDLIIAGFKKAGLV
ncbi:hypothetical protein DPMN_107970 [Dreissena polymorpha]|uniref:DDE-1 domain-containing protein n=1 Tax=Dreissena polymorpha TaxID=45954 RepID=A0A9D4K7R3_DREPO|nr:hypothetical protein DPMN_107970 [Dreissena polymorpha]